MIKIPATSEFSFRNGIWIVFKNKGQEIAINNRCLFLPERIFVNGQLISKKRSSWQRNEHSFTFEGNVYNIKIVSSKQNAKTECLLVKNNVCIKKILIHGDIDIGRVQPSKQLSLFVLCYPVLIIAGYFTSVFKIGALALVISLLIALYPFVFFAFLGTYFVTRCFEIFFEEIDA